MSDVQQQRKMSNTKVNNKITSNQYDVQPPRTNQTGNRRGYTDLFSTDEAQPNNQNQPQLHRVVHISNLIGQEGKGQTFDYEKNVNNN